ncbi:hypothetical protein KVU_0787 [Ketogulonicigenium vulgare WSH-001]|uniref:Uncharacterized protein n=1 Tax=Ketogulonicigenium vulgare (strain WSH-001) TaxID=759362 RepID=F9Y4Z4_KETVW|nr:hypothetical protein KVU_0787 [Ketogulonicigenium vulgare WSH-001]
MGDKARVEIGLDRLRAAFGAIARIAEPAERHFGQGKAKVVDGQHTRAHPFAQTRRRLGRAGKRIGRKAKGQAVRLGQRGIHGCDTVDHRDGAKGFVIHDQRILRHIGQHGRGIEIALVANAATAGDQTRAAVDGILDHAFQCRDAPVIRERTHLAVRVQPVADLDLFCRAGKAVDEPIRDAILHQKARGRDADLTRVAEFMLYGQGDGRLDIGIIEHQHGGVAAQLHRGALHMQAGEAGKMFANRGRAGERDFADGRMRDQIFRNLGRHAEHKVHDAGRHARINKTIDHRGGRGGGLFGRLDDDGTAGAERGRQLAHDLVDRKVPRRKGRDGADRVLDRDLQNAGRAGGDHLTIGAAAFLGEPVDHIGGGGHFALGLAQGFALFQRQQHRDCLGPGAQQICGAAHNLAAFQRRDVFPLVEAALRGSQSGLEIGRRGVGDVADHLFGRGIDHGNATAVRGFAPNAVNEKEGISIHRMSLRRRGAAPSASPAS